MLVEYNRPNVHDAYEMKFRPGINNVPVDKWEIAKKDSEIKRFLAEGVLTEILPDQGKKDEEPSSELPEINKFSAQKALQIVKRTFHMDILTRWKHQDRRPEVAEAVVQQIEEITKKP